MHVCARRRLAALTRQPSLRHVSVSAVRCGSRSPPSWLDPLSAVPSRKEADDALLTFPEAREAAELLSSGGPASAALPLLLRVVDVCSSMMRGSPLHDAALRRCVSVCESLGDVTQGQSLLVQLCASASATPTDVAQYQLHLASLHLACGDITATKSSLDEAEARCGSPSGTPGEAAMWTAIASVRAAVSCVTGDADDHDLDATAVAVSELADVAPELRHRVLHHTAVYYLFQSGAGAVHDPLVAGPAAGPGVEAAESLHRQAADSCRLWFAAAQEASARDQNSGADTAQLRILSQLGSLELLWAEKGAEATVEDLKKVLDEASAAAADSSDPTPGYVKSWPLAMLGRVYHSQEEAVTSEGLFRAALDEFDMLDRERKSRLPAPTKAVLGDSLRWYARLLNEWEQRGPEADIVLSRADDVVGPASFTSSRLRHVATPRWAFHAT